MDHEKLKQAPGLCACVAMNACAAGSEFPRGGNVSSLDIRINFRTLQFSACLRRNSLQSLCFETKDTNGLQQEENQPVS